MIVKLYKLQSNDRVFISISNYLAILKGILRNYATDSDKPLSPELLM